MLSRPVQADTETAEPRPAATVEVGLGMELVVPPEVSPDSESAPEILVGSRFSAAVLAICLKLARDLVSLALVLRLESQHHVNFYRSVSSKTTYFSFTTMTIPAWQCLPWEQYSHNGVAALTSMVYVGIMPVDSLAATSM